MAISRLNKKSERHILYVGCHRYSQTLSKTGLKMLPNRKGTSGFAVFIIDVLIAFDYMH
jgi:hypothetical protein